MYKFKIYIKKRSLSQVDEKVAEICLIFNHTYDFNYNNFNLFHRYIYIYVYVEFIE